MKIVLLKNLKLLTNTKSFLLSMKVSLLIDMKMPNIVDIFIFISREKFHAQLIHLAWYTWCIFCSFFRRMTMFQLPRRCLSFSSSLFVASVVSYVMFVSSLYVPHHSFFWCLRTTVLFDCGISWESSLTCIFFSVCFPENQSPSEKQSTPLGKNLLPRGAKFSFQNRPLFRRGKDILTELLPLEFTLIQFCISSFEVTFWKKKRYTQMKTNEWFFIIIYFGPWPKVHGTVYPCIHDVGCYDME